MIFFASWLSAALAVQGAGGTTQIPRAPAPPEKTKIVARVDGDPIAAGDLENFLWDWHMYEVREEMIAMRAVELKAKSLGLTASEEEIRRAYDNQLTQMRANLQGGSVEAYLQNRGGSFSRLWMGARREVLLAKIVAQAFKPSEFIFVSTLLVRPASEAATDLGKAIALAQAAYDELQKGAKWVNVFRKYNIEKDAKLDGQIGWVMIAGFPKTTQLEIANLKAGGITKPVQTQFGIQVFRIDRKAADVPATDLEELKKQFVMSGRRTYLENLIKSMKIERF